MDDRDKNLIIKKSNLLHMDDYQNRNKTAPPSKQGAAKRDTKTSARNAKDDRRDTSEDRPNIGDEKRPA